VGILTGIVGAAGGFGGFLLPSALGAIKDRTGTFGLGFAVLAFVSLAGAGALLAIGRIWRAQWDAGSARRAGLLPMERVPWSPAETTLVE
jgi:NNP family nitrate/nitrite transporter-like MFS transporter